MKMKKKVLSAAVLAAMSIGSAQAVNLSQTGHGEVMIIPYYTVRGDEKTLVSIVNTTDETKAVKVRFHEAMNTREVLDFNLYLSPYDVWTAAIQDDGNGGAELVTSDLSCTVPAIDPDGVAFRAYAYNGQMADSPMDGGPTDRDRTREGYVAFIEMGHYDTDLDGTMPWGAGPDSTHVAGVPINCGTLRASWAEGGIWTLNANEDLDAPTGGLFAEGAIINVGTGTEIGMPTTTLESYSDIVLHSAPGSLSPNLQDTNPSESVVMLNDGVADMAQVYHDFWLFPEDAVSAILQTQVLENEYTVNPAVDAETDWVVTFPTKRFYVDTVFTPVVRNPFTTLFPMSGTSCDTVNAVYWDREEQLITGDTDFSPLPDGTSFQLCYEANVINFGGSDVLSSELVDVDFNLAEGFNNGWAALGFLQDHHELVNAASLRVYEGLPAIGFRATRLMNANVGVGAAYSVSAEHRYARVVDDTMMAADWTQGLSSM